MWNGNNFSHVSRDQINSRWNILFPSYRSNFCSLTWIGDAVPGLVVKMSCQLPSIKLELVCRETMKWSKRLSLDHLSFLKKKEGKPAFLSRFFLNLFRFIGHRHANIFSNFSRSHLLNFKKKYSTSPSLVLSYSIYSLSPQSNSAKTNNIAVQVNSKQSRLSSSILFLYVGKPQQKVSVRFQLDKERFKPLEYEAWIIDNWTH